MAGLVSSVVIMWKNGSTGASIEAFYTLSNGNSGSVLFPSTPITIDVAVTPTVVLNSSATSIAKPGTITFTTQVTNAGTTPQYGWILDGVQLPNTTTGTKQVQTNTLSFGQHKMKVYLYSSIACKSLADIVAEKTFTVLMPTSVDAGPNLSICRYSGLNPLAGATVTGGTWSGSGGTNNMFDPLAVAPGSYTLTYSFTNGTTTISDIRVVTVVAGSAECDRQALVDLYNATNGPNWTNKTNWHPTNTNISTWYGVTVTTGRVTGINLQNNLLLGELPESMGNLTSLQTLDLDNNQIRSLPTSIGNLTALKFLYLTYNQISSLPTSVGSLTALETLYLSYNQISSLPSSIGTLSALKDFYISDNQLSSIPSSISGLTSLYQFNLQNNQLSSIPTSINSLTALRYLFLSYNELSSLPSTITSLTGLYNLYLNDNQLSSLPSTIGSMASLQYLLLSNNQLNSLPTSITSLTALITFHVDNNQLSSIPSSISNITTLQSFFTKNNQFTFEDLEPFQTKSYFVSTAYSPQANIDLNFDATTHKFSVTIGGTANIYQWKKNGVVISGATANNITLTQADVDANGNYQCIVTSTKVPGLTILSAIKQPTLIAKSDPATNPELNYVTANTVLISGKKLETDLANLDVTLMSQSTQYLDGLGRPIQSVSTGGSPTKLDIVQPIVYDQ